MVYAGVMRLQSMVHRRHCTTVGSGGAIWEYSRGSWQDWRPSPPITKPSQLTRPTLKRTAQLQAWGGQKGGRGRLIGQTKGGVETKLHW